MTIFLSLCIFIILLIDLILGVNSFLSEIETIYILFLLLPVTSITFLAKPTKNAVMKRHVHSPKYLPYLNHSIFLLKSSLIKILLTSFILFGIKILYYH